MALEPSEGFAGADAEATAEADAAVPPAVPSGASREGAPQEAPGESGELLADAAQEEAPPLVEYQVPLSLSDAVVRDLEARQQQQSEQLDVSPPSDEDPGGREQRVPEEQRRADSYADRTRSRFLIIFVARDGSDGD